MSFRFIFMVPQIHLVINESETHGQIGHFKGQF